MARHLKTEPEDVILPDDVVFCDFGSSVQWEAQRRYGCEFCRPCASVLHHRGYVDECIRIDEELKKGRRSMASHERGRRENHT